MGLGLYRQPVFYYNNPYKLKLVNLLMTYQTAMQRAIEYKVTNGIGFNSETKFLKEDRERKFFFVPIHLTKETVKES